MNTNSGKDRSTQEDSRDQQPNSFTKKSPTPSARFDRDGLKKTQSAVHLELAARSDSKKTSLSSEGLLHQELLQRFMPPSFLVDERANLLQTYGGGQRFLKIGDGRIKSRLIDLVSEDLKALVDGAINRVFQEHKRVTCDRVEVNGSSVRVSAEPVGEGDQRPRAIVTIVPLHDYLADIDDGGEQGSTSSHQVKALQDEVTHFTGIQSDISKQVDFEQKLDIAKRDAEKANEAKTIFLSNMSHDIRTPLTTVIGIAEILRDEESDERRNEMLELVVRSGKHLSELISGILELSKIESGTLPVANEPCSPVEIVEDVIAVMKTQAMDKGIELNLSTDDSLPQTINSDSLRLRRIVLNLVGNAVKFTDEGSVDVSIKRGNRVPNKDEIRIVVSDTGQGISAESLEQIFEPFVQVEGKENELNRVGTGLGLTISKNLAQLLGGSITADSKLGKGSNFRFSIPIQTSESPDVAAAVKGNSRTQSAASKGDNLEGRLIWAADDEPGIRLIVKTLLENAGAKVRMFDDGAKLVDAWDKSSESADRLETEAEPDAVVVDMQMPNLGGIGVAQHLRGAGVQLPIVALTAAAYADDRDQCMEAGIDEHLSKPIDSRILISTICELLDALQESVDLNS